MAYCKECGAYIPDGRTKCLACGFDEAEQPKAKYEYNDGSAYAYQSEKAEPIQEEMERQREQRREENRRWAEEEKQRRQQEKARQQEQRKEEHAYKAPQKSSTDTSKIFAALSYLSILFVLPFIFSPNDKYAKFHAKQGAILFLANAVLSFAANLIGFGWVITLAHLYLIYKGMMNALNGKVETLPWIGELFNK